MTIKRKTLAEAASDILGGNVAAKRASAEKFGAGFTRNVNIPGQKTFGSGDSEYLGGQVNDPVQAGITAAANSGPRAVAPGAVSDDHGEKSPNDIRTGKTVPTSGSKHATVNADGIVEEGGDHSEFNSPTTHPIKKLGPDSDNGNKLTGNGKPRSTTSEELDEEPVDKSLTTNPDSKKDKRDALAKAMDGKPVKKYPTKGTPRHLKKEEDISEDDEMDEETVEEEGNDGSATTHGWQQNPSNDDPPDEFYAKPVGERVKAYARSKDAAEALKEDVKAMFQGQEGLTEDFVAKATAIFEAAVISRAIQVAEEIEAEYIDQLETVAEAIQENIEAKVDDYITYIAEGWVQENELEVESGLKADLMESFLDGMKDLFEEHYIDIPAEKVQVVEQLADKVEDLEGKLNEELQRGIELTKMVNEYRRSEVLGSITEGLTATQAEKIKNLAEAVDFTDEDAFIDKIEVLKENYFPKTSGAPKKEQLNETNVQQGETIVRDETAGPMAKYARAISRTKLS